MNFRKIKYIRVKDSIAHRKKFDGLMRAKNTRTSQSPLHLEIETLIWEMECMRNLKQFSVTFTTNYSQLVKMVCFRTRRMISLCKLFERHKILDEKFQ